MRLFTAINIPVRTKKLIDRKRELIKKEVDHDFKWVERENWHLTLKFLGEVNEKQIEVIKEILAELVSDQQQFPIQFEGIGAFPDLNYPMVLYLGVNRGRKELINLFHVLDGKLSESELKDEKREYIPHLTLARSKNSTDLKCISSKLKGFIQNNLINIYMQATGISLMKSVLYSDGPVYEELFMAQFK